jgi:glutamate racemase
MVKQGLNNTTCDPQAIGVFDSGVGGLSVLSAFKSQLPLESFIYVADSGNAPYGDRSASFINERVSSVAKFLVSRNAKSIVVACNTATVTAVTMLRRQYNIPIIGMEPAIKPATLLTRTGIVGVLATARTIHSDAVAKLCTAHAGMAKFLLQPCPGLVERVENGDTSSDALKGLLQGFIEPLIAKGADTLVLGCTHYVFLRPIIQEIIGPNVAVIESSDAVARQLERRLSETNKMATTRDNAATVYFTTGSLAKANVTFSALLNKTVVVNRMV